MTATGRNLSLTLRLQSEYVTVYDAGFYRAGTIKRGSYMYDEADQNKAMPPREVPQRYFREIVLQLTKATSSSKERNEEGAVNRFLAGVRRKTVLE